MSGSRRWILTAASLPLAVGCFVLGVTRARHYETSLGLVLSLVAPLLILGACAHAWSRTRQKGR